MHKINRCVRTARMLLLILICAVLLISCSRNNGGNKNTVEKPPEPVPENVIYNMPEKVTQNNVYLENINLGGLKQSDAQIKVEEICNRLNIEAKNAKLDEKKWVVIENEKSGKKVNVEKLLNNLMNAVEGEKISLKMEMVSPAITAQQLKKNIVETGKFTTTLMDKRENRMTNISIAAKKIDMLKIAPGEEFSFNGALGKRTEVKGYEEAPIIIKTEDGYKSVDGIGGGICQLSTTLYNAAEKAQMKITERHVHSKEVKYVPKGKDATVSYGSSDLKFVNTKNYPIMIRTYVGKNSLTVKVFENRN